jgi:hypothetical protein
MATNTEEKINELITVFIDHKTTPKEEYALIKKTAEELDVPAICVKRMVEKKFHELMN